MVLPADEGVDKSWILISKRALEDVEVREELSGESADKGAFVNPYLKGANSQKQFIYFRTLSDDFSKKIAKVWITSALETLAFTSSSIVKRFEAIDWSQSSHVKVAIQSALDRLFCCDLISCESYKKYLSEVDLSPEEGLHLSPFFKAWNEARDNALRECELDLKSRSLVLKGCGTLTFLSSAAFSLQFILPRQEECRVFRSKEFSCWSVVAMSLGLFSLFRSTIYYAFLPSAIKECTPAKLSFLEEPSS